MSSHGASFLGTKRPREEHESADDKSAEPQAVGYPSTMVAEVGNVVAAKHCIEHEHNSPPRHTPGVTPGGFNLHRNSSFDDIDEVERDRLLREASPGAKLRSTSPGLGKGEGDDMLGLGGCRGHEDSDLGGGDYSGYGHGQGVSAGTAVEATPRYRRVDSLGGDDNLDIAMSPGELGGSQYIMSPGDNLASTLQRSQSTMSDVHSALPSSVEEVAAETLRSSQRLFPIFVRGRKVVHLVRHGQSTYNEAISGPGSWDEPNIFDAPLTKLGIDQAKSLGSFLAKLPNDAVWVTSALTRAMETCLYGYKASLEVKRAQKRKGAAVREAAGGGGGVGGGRNGRGKSRLSHGNAGGSNGGGGPGAGGSNGNANGALRASDENGYIDGTPMIGTTPGQGYTPMTTGGTGQRGTTGVAIDAEDDRAAATNNNNNNNNNFQGGASGSGAGATCHHHQDHHDDKTPAPVSRNGVGGAAQASLCFNNNGELAPDAVGASPCEAVELDTAEMSAWGDKVIVHQHLSEKVSTSGDIGRHKGVLMNEFPLLALGLSRLPGDVWWYSQANRPNDAEREQFGSHEPSAKFKERVNKFRHWLMSREDKVFVVFGHSTFFKELTGGHRSLKNCEVHTFHL